MRSAARIAAWTTLLALCAAGAWAQEPAKPAKAQQVKPEIAQELKALRVGRLELMKEQIELKLLRERGAPAKDLEARESQIKALGEKQRGRMAALREKHPQLARRLRAAGKMGLGQGMAGGRGAMRGRQGAGFRGPMGRGMAPGARTHQFGPQGQMGGHGMGKGRDKMGMGKRGMHHQRPGMAWGRQGQPMGPAMGRQRMGMNRPGMGRQGPRGAWGQQCCPMYGGTGSGRGFMPPHPKMRPEHAPKPAQKPTE